MNTSSDKHFATINLNQQTTNTAFKIRRPVQDLADCSLASCDAKSLAHYRRGLLSFDAETFTLRFDKHSGAKAFSR
jgi:hypothetical protein